MKNVLFLIICLVLFSCNSESSDNLGEIVVYDPQNVHYFKEIADSVDFIPLQIKDLALDDFSEVFINEVSIFVVDKTLKKIIYYFDRTGRYMNLIGSTGRAYNEYLDLSDFMLYGDSVLIFDSKTQKIFFYGTDGQLLRRDNLTNPFQKAYRIENDYILYLGDCNGHLEYKLFMDRSEDRFLESNDNVIHFKEMFSVFSSHDDFVYVRETLSNKIRLIHEKKISTVYTFDFGSYNIPDKFYTQSSVHKSTEVLMNNDYTYQNRFCITNQFSLIENVINKQDGLHFVYAILNKSNHKWIWVNGASQQENDLFSGTFKFIDEEGYFYFLLDKGKQNALAEYNIESGEYEYGLLKCKLRIN